jgi:hypothetical protein
MMSINPNSRIDMDALIEHVKEKHPDLIAESIVKTTIEALKVSLANWAVETIAAGTYDGETEFDGVNDILDRYIDEAAYKVAEEIDDDCCKNYEFRGEY